jgi:hypothetical protein
MVHVERRSQARQVLGIGRVGSLHQQTYGRGFWRDAAPEMEAV